MRFSWLWLAVPACGAAGVAFLACDNSGTVALPYQDGGPTEDVVHFDGPTPFDTGPLPDAPTDVAVEAEAGAPPPSRLLFTYNGSASSEVVAFGLASKAVDGRITVGDSLAGTYAGSSAPWLLEEGNSVVARLDAQHPWFIDASWNVQMNDYVDAGYTESYADPDAVVVGAGTKAYVLRYTRNTIGIIDTSQSPDGGAPVGSIDLSGLVQAGGDGYVQPVGGVFVPSQSRVYVVLANINRGNINLSTYDLLCSSTTAMVVAIDTTKDALAPLGDAGSTGWALPGYSPSLGAGGLAFDAQTGTSGRLLVLEAGCYQQAGDGGEGPLVQREVDAVDLASGTATKLLDLTGNGFPYQLDYVDAHHAVIGADKVYAWDPTTTTLGPAIANAPQSYVHDGNGNLVGMNAVTGAEGGVTGYQAVSMALSSGTVTTLGSFDFTLTGGFTGGVTLWPAP
jgi:hypothetical protein